MQHLQITLDKSALHMNSSTLHENSCYFGLFTCNLLSPYDTSLDFPLFLQKIYPNCYILWKKRKYSCSFFFPIDKNHQLQKSLTKFMFSKIQTEQQKRFVTTFSSLRQSLLPIVYSFSKYPQIIPLSLWCEYEYYKYKNTKRTNKCRTILTPHFIVDLGDYRQGWIKTLLKS